MYCSDDEDAPHGMEMLWKAKPEVEAELILKIAHTQGAAQVTT